MNSEKTEQKFGVSKTRYKNMKKRGLEVNEEGIKAYKDIVKTRKKEEKKVQREKFKESKSVRDSKTKKK